MKFPVHDLPEVLRRMEDVRRSGRRAIVWRGSEAGAVFIISRSRRKVRGVSLSLDCRESEALVWAWPLGLVRRGLAQSKEDT